jgi:catechol 2,3-dioxygenase-like lactoylglutathione lyase family enzyme
MSMLSPPAQIAYFVTDIEASAREMGQRFGAGPFYLIRRIELASALHRERSCRFVHSSAYGQWGGVMLELVQQDEEGPSPFRDLFAPGQQGLHHLAFFVPDLQSAIHAHARNGMPLATRATTTGGTEFAFVDASATLGHMIELYEPTPALNGFYRQVREASIGWNGDDPVRWL